VLGLGFGLNAGDERPFDVQGPPLGGGRGVIGLRQEVLAPAPPGEHVVKVGEVGQGEIDVDLGGATGVDLGDENEKGMRIVSLPLPHSKSW
jgi:hypothetical protein